jgi:hypothetical protein
LLAALAIKEDESLVLGVLGVAYAAVAARRRDWAGVRFGVAAALIAAVTFTGYFGVVRRLAGANEDRWFALDYFTGHSFDTPHGAMVVLGRVGFLLEVLVPLAFVPLATPWFALAVPGLVEVLASRWSITYTNGQHYAGVWIAYVLAANAVALASIARKAPGRATAMAATSLGLCILNLAVASPTHWGHYLRAPAAHDAALDRLVARVPAGAAVATYDEVYSHLGFDPRAQIGFAPVAVPEYALFDSHYDGGAWLQTYRPRLLELVREGLYRPLAEDDGATLYRRTGSGSTGQN